MPPFRSARLVHPTLAVTALLLTASTAAASAASADPAPAGWVANMISGTDGESQPADGHVGETTTTPTDIDGASWNQEPIEDGAELEQDPLPD